VVLLPQLPEIILFWLIGLFSLFNILMLVYSLAKKQPVLLQILSIIVLVLILIAGGFFWVNDGWILGMIISFLFLILLCFSLYLKWKN